MTYARFGHMNGQETVGDFCVSYGLAGDGGYVWEPEGILAANQLSTSDYAGLAGLTRYLPLAGEPIAFGFKYPGWSCNDALGGWGSPDPFPVGYTHYTVLAVPYSGEAMMVWAVGDPVEQNEGPAPGAGLRIVNASSYSLSISASAEQPPSPEKPLGEFALGNSPKSYLDTGSNHLWLLNVSDPNEAPATVTFDFVAVDLLPLVPPKTIYYTSAFQRTALVCSDTRETLPGDPKSAYCYSIVGTVQ